MIKKNVALGVVLVVQVLMRDVGAAARRRSGAAPERAEVVAARARGVRLRARA